MLDEPQVLPIRQRRNWKRLLLTMTLAAAVGIGAGGVYLAVTGEDAASARDLARPAAYEGAVTEFASGDRGAPVELQGETLDGELLSLADRRGEVVVVNVWGSWCAPCREEAPVLAAAARRYAPEGVSMVGINVRDNAAAAQAFERRFGIEYPSIADFDGRTLLAVNQYVPANAVPVTLLLDRQGRVAARVLGVLTRSTLDALLEPVLAETVK